MSQKLAIPVDRSDVAGIEKGWMDKSYDLEGDKFKRNLRGADPAKLCRSTEKS
jgi:hypothetical protein